MHLKPIAFCCCVALAAPLLCQQAAPVTVPGLGTLTFPVTTTSNAARQDFLRATLLLHVFHYEQARAAFRQAQQLDPGFTMAWWGEAMAWNYGVWNEQFPDSARAALAKLAPTAAARAAMARTPREREYLGTVEALYGAGSKPHRDTVYAAAVARLSADYPHDDEAKLFHALALLGLNQGVRDVPTYQRALAIAMDVFRRHPDHPGASHYVIHASDDPAHAAIGLDAARALAKSSPAAEHAQHMTSHIFMALGMWDDLVTANERATHVIPVPGGAPMKMPGMNSSGCGHYNSWLDYGYLAQGRLALATALLKRCEADPAHVAGAVYMWSRYLLDTEAWAGDQAAWNPALGDDPDARLTWHFVRGFAATRRGAPGVAERELAALHQARNDAVAGAAKSRNTSPETVEDLKRDGILDLELQAAIQSARGKHDEAVVLLRQATGTEDAMAYAFGPPEIDKPSHELLGEEFLLVKRDADARVEFLKALRTTPRRPMALRGLARADEGVGLAAEARATWRELANIWHAADAAFPGLDEARRNAAVR